MVEELDHAAGGVFSSKGRGSKGRTTCPLGGGFSLQRDGQLSPGGAVIVGGAGEATGGLAAL
jgi:hypothetical protein